MLVAGTACEAFFTDVKARILAHGYVLAFESFHEVWMLPGDSSALARHLSKYVITEDVTVTDLEISSNVVVFRESPELLASPAFYGRVLNPGNTLCGQLNGLTEGNSDLIVLQFTWASSRLIAVAGSPEEVSKLRMQTSAIADAEVPSDQLELLRILERFPKIGCDMSNDHLAPEAERNSIAISYTKGCYLGQEPIARLDAMGHVNRALRMIELPGECSPLDSIGRDLLTADNTPAGTVTSAARNDAATILCLAMVKVSAALQPLFCTLSSGEKLLGHCKPL